MPGARGHVNHPDKIFGHLKINPGALRRLGAKEKPMARVNGGVTAPRGGRGRGRVNPPGRGMMNPTGQGPTGPPTPGGRGNRGQAQGGKGAGISLGGAALPGPGGRQLAARVSSGAITQEQAQRTMQQRQTLAKALGPNWRDKLQVGGKSFADVNKGLKADPGNAKLAAIRKKLVANRATVLAGARKGGAGKKKAPAEQPAGAGTE